MARHGAERRHAAEAGVVREPARPDPAGLDGRDGLRAAKRRRDGAREEVHDQVRTAEVARGRMTTSMRVWFATLLVLARALLVTPAPAHELTMAEMEVRETSPGEFFWQWSAANDKRPMGNDLVPRWPESCEAGANVVRCGKDGLKGTLSVEGVGKRYSAAIVKV